MPNTKFSLINYTLMIASLASIVCYGRSSVCVDNSPSCTASANAGYCIYSYWTASFYHKMARYCRKACGFCRCTQYHQSCVRWATEGYCTRSQAFMQRNCPKSCDLCGCVDENRKCPLWAKHNWCSRRPSYMHVYCRKSCNVCRCTDVYKSCNHWATLGKCNLSPSFMKLYCRKACRFCGAPKPTVPPVIKPPAESSKVNSKFCLPTSRKRIVGGNKSIPGKFPWIVAVYRKADSKKVICGASLITDQWILCAAHCFTREGGKDPRNYFVRLGEYHLEKTEGFEVTASIDKIILHYKFNIRTYDNDIALLHLTKKITFTKRIGPVCLADVKDTFSPGSTCVISGWGALEEDGATSKMLHSAKVPYVGRQVCQTAFDKVKQIVTFNMVCAGHVRGGTDTCEGDSGGPLMCSPKTDSSYEQVGIVSWGFGCARKGLYGVYTRVQSFRDWIDKYVLIGV